MIADPRVQLSSPVRYTRAQVEACWSQIQVPVQLLYGADSEQLREYPGALERFRASLPRADIRSVAPAGHLLHHEQPRQTAAHILEFAARNERGAGG
jgi:pimeloyl-ACP methyl ester carboxylesterase